MRSDRLVHPHGVMSSGTPAVEQQHYLDSGSEGNYRPSSAPHSDCVSTVHHYFESSPGRHRLILWMAMESAVGTLQGLAAATDDRATDGCRSGGSAVPCAAPRQLVMSSVGDALDHPLFVRPEASLVRQRLPAWKAVVCPIHRKLFSDSAVAMESTVSSDTNVDWVG